jgi:hypothetical protein
MKASPSSLWPSKVTTISAPSASSDWEVWPEHQQTSSSGGKCAGQARRQAGIHTILTEEKEAKGASTHTLVLTQTWQDNTAGGDCTSDTFDAACC